MGGTGVLLVKLLASHRCGTGNDAPQKQVLFGSESGIWKKVERLLGIDKIYKLDGRWWTETISWDFLRTCSHERSPRGCNAAVWENTMMMMMFDSLARTICEFEFVWCVVLSLATRMFLRVLQFSPSAKINMWGVLCAKILNVEVVGVRV